MTKTLLGINLDKIKFAKTKPKNTVDLTLDLILKGNWDPHTRQHLSEQKTLLSQDELIKFAVNKLQMTHGIPKFWCSIFLPKVWIIRVLFFAILFVLEFLSNYFEIILTLIKKNSLGRFLNEFTQIYSFTWLFTVQEFMQYGRARITTINIVENRQDKFLLALRRHQWIPGDEGWGWFQGGLELDEEKEFLQLINQGQKNLKQSIKNPTIANVISDSIRDLKNPLSEDCQQIIINRGRQEIKEETDLDIAQLNVLKAPKYSGQEFMSVSIKRFLLLGCLYNVQEKFMVYWFYSKDSHKIKTDFENAGGDWFDNDEVPKKLVPEKLADWEVFLKIN